MQAIKLPPSMEQQVPRPFTGILDVMEGKVLWIGRTGLLFFVCFLMLLYVSRGNPILPGPLGFFGIFGSLVMGAICGHALWELVALLRLWRAGVLTEGVFCDVESKEVRGHALINAGVEFRDAAGRVWEGRLIIPAGAIKPGTGDSIPVVFLPGRPAVAAAFTATEHMEKLTFGPRARRGVTV